MGFRDLGLGRIVGTPTYGAVIATGSYRLINGGRIRTPGSLVVTYDPSKPNNYGINLENYGVAPDVWVENTPEDEITALSQLLDAHADSISETEGRAYFQREGDIDFHYRVALASQNQWILDNLHGELYQLIRMCRHQSGQFPSRAQLALDQHRQIADAIARRDEELAELLMRRHISGAWEIVKKILEDQND